jgi:HEAT repeat protein
MDTQKFLAGIESSNPDERFAAWRAGGAVSPSVIPQLGKLAASDKPGIAKAALEALTTMTHSVGKDAKSANRAEVIQGLLALSSVAYALRVRTHAFRLLSNIAVEDSVPAIAKEIQNSGLREEVVYCLERIPGDAAIQALTNAYKSASDDFKPRILAALGHRRASSATQLCIEAMGSANKEIAIAGAKAIARIGPSSGAEPAFPVEAGLSEWQKTERIDSILRYADAQANAGNAAGAIGAYRAILNLPQEHFQCAAIIGMGKLATPEAAALIMPKLKSPIRKVRITALNTWRRIASA